jgi:glutamyl-tRNA reductase
MLLTALGISHKSAPLPLLERVVFAPEDLRAAHDALREHVAHGVILSTCNRVEIYGLVGHSESGRRALLRFLAGFFDLPPDEVEPHTYVHAQEHAVGHLFRVAAGLDSMMLGETQVLSQVRSAYAAAAHHGVPGPVLARLFHQAVQVGRRAHRETQLAHSVLSLSAAAVDLARNRLGDLASLTALVVGAGGTGRLTAHSLQASGAGSVLVMNRTVEQAEVVARAVGGEAVALEALEPALARADLVISSTGARRYLLQTPVVRAAMANRPQRPLYCIDLAVPRDVDPSVADLPNVHLYNLDDLHDICRADASGRAGDVLRAESIVEEEVQRFFQWWDAREVVPTITALRTQAEAIREAELARALHRLGPISERDRDTIDALTSAIVNKLLHQPTVRLKERSADHDGRHYAPAVRALFALPD